MPTLVPPSPRHLMAIPSSNFKKRPWLSVLRPTFGLEGKNMAIEYDMPLGMLLWRMYCAGCGARLVRKKLRKQYRRGEEGFRNTLSNRSILNVQSYTTVTYVYRCPSCHREISYGDQVKVAKEQARTGRKILPEE